MRLIFILLIAILTTSCLHLPGYSYTQHIPSTATQRVITVRIDKNFSFDDKIAIDDALNTWNYALNNTIVFKVISSNFDMEPSEITDAGLLILKIDHNSYLIPVSETPNADVLAFIPDLGSKDLYVVRDRIADGLQLKEIIMHEIGHFFYVKHTTDPKSLMYSQLFVYYQQCIDKYTIEEVAKTQYIDINRLNYCIYDE